MRIANNIMAMNTHRVYSINNTNISKSIEKLSSGYRINRAGDDAAGLAISEKMRAQIRGLQMASKNSQDAISMVQTAEGALQTTHDILQRMREIAVQSASDTNETTIDRAALDKEFQALMAEIDDTASKTAFNDQKLIDGTFQKNFLQISNESTPTGFAVVENGEDGKQVSGVTGFNSTAVAGTYTFTASASTVAGTTGAVTGETAEGKAWKDDAGVTKVTIKATPSDEWSFDMLDGEEYAVTMSATTDADNNVTFNIDLEGESGDKIYGSTIKNINDIVDSVKEGDYELEMDLGFGVKAFVSIAQDENATAESVANSIASAINGISGASVEFNVDGTPAATQTAPTGTVTPPASPDGSIAITAAAADASIGDLLNGKSGSLAITGASESDAVFTLTIDGKTYTSSATDISGVTSVELIGAGGANDKITLTLGGTVDSTALTDFKTDAQATTIAFAGGATASAQIGSTYVGEIATAPKIYISDFTDGTDVSTGAAYNQKYTVSADGTDADTLKIQVEADNNGDITTSTVNILKATLTDMKAAGGLQTMSVDLGGSIGTIELTINTDEFADADTMAAGIADYFNTAGDFTGGSAKEIDYTGGVTEKAGDPVTTAKVTLSGAATGDVTLTAGMDSITLGGVTVKLARAITEDDLADEDSVNEMLTELFGDTGTASVTIGTGEGKDFVVQTGANEGDELSINIDAMNARTLGIDVSNIATREAASKAITAVNDAINQVSMQRADLGALQNRLEFKIQNLDISAENLQSAESRIRDLDMAAEMTTFTRNNILAQAATAMLAQANSLPQGVLQLLG